MSSTNTWHCCCLVLAVASWFKNCTCILLNLRCLAKAVDYNLLKWYFYCLPWFLLLMLSMMPDVAKDVIVAQSVCLSVTHVERNEMSFGGTLVWPQVLVIFVLDRGLIPPHREGGDLGVGAPSHKLHCSCGVCFDWCILVTFVYFPAVYNVLQMTLLMPSVCQVSATHWRLSFR